MIVLLFQQPVFTYCGHTQQFFIEHCGCPEVGKSSCPHCQEAPPADPCDKCSEKIQLEVDDLIWSDFTPDPPRFSEDVMEPDRAEICGAMSATLTTTAPSRPPPLPGVPRFLLHSVFRL